VWGSRVGQGQCGCFSLSSSTRGQEGRNEGRKEGKEGEGGRKGGREGEEREVEERGGIAEYRVNTGQPNREGQAIAGH
jgi:hypothetical protein